MSSVELEGNAAIDLHNPAVQRHSQKRAIRRGCWSDSGNDRSEIACGVAIYRQIEVWMVEKVKEIGADSQLNALA